MDNHDEDIRKLLEGVRQEMREKFNLESARSSARSTTTDSEKSSKALTINSSKLNPNVLNSDSESKSAKDMRFLNKTAAPKIDDEINRIRLDLKKSYNLFIQARDTLESISFKNVRNRIKDLHLAPTDNELNEIIGDDVRPIEKNLEKLNELMTDKFRNHPGEFADIPEMSSFFKVCSQLEHGLKELSNQQNNFSELQKKINWAVNVSDIRGQEIRNVLKVENEQKET